MKKAMNLVKEKIFGWRTLVYFLIFLCLMGVTIYPDEQAYWIQLFRGHRDGWVINNFMPMCESFWTTKVPISWRAGRELLYVMNGLIDRPVMFRALGITYFSVLVYLFYLLEKNIMGNIQKEPGFFNILFFGLIPVSLVYLRPEALMLICLLFAIFIFESNYHNSRRLTLGVITLLFLYSVEVNLHGRAIFMAPIFIYLIGSMAYRIKSKVVIMLVFLIFLWLFIETVSVYKALYECGENKNVKEIIDSLRFNPEIIKGDFNKFIFEILARHKDIYNIFKGAVFFNPHQAFPLGPKDFSPFVLDLFGFVKTVLASIAIFTFLGFFYLATYLRVMVATSRSRYFLTCALMAFLYLDVILMKTDRFYEAAIFWPILILIFIYQISIFNSINIAWHTKASLFCKKLLLMGFYIMTTAFLSYYGSELILKGGVTYVSIRKHDSALYRDAVQRAATNSGIDIVSSKLLVGDFHTIHYTAAGSFPVMSNLFWWFSDKSTSNYQNDYGKLKLLMDLDSDGFISRCDSMPAKLRPEAAMTLINQNGDKSLENTLCTISKSHLKNINFEDKLIKE
jgi:hypothetical protein